MIILCIFVSLKLKNKKMKESKYMCIEFVTLTY